MATLLSGLLGVLIATNQPSAVSNLVRERTGAKIEVADPNDPVDREYHRLLELDDSAQTEVDRWLKDNDKLAGVGASIDHGTMKGRVQQRLEPVEKAYKDFLERNPKHVKARIAYGSFLDDIGREDDSKEQYAKAREIDPANPVPWNALGNYYGHNGEVTNAFACYQKAIDLKPDESLYYHNLAISVYMFRLDATNYYTLSVQQVFDKAMALYRKALELDPENFPLATDLAQSYYGIQPPRVKEALEAWEAALKLARDDIEREGVRLHFARWQRTAGNFAAAHRELDLVTNQMYAITKTNILKMLAKSEATNAATKATSP